MFDGTKGHGDGSSPWGVHDMSGGASELVFACSDPNATCRPGAACPCEALGVFAGHPDVAALAAAARYALHGVGNQGVRCAKRVAR
jgi:hypothetical protein